MDDLEKTTSSTHIEKSDGMIDDFDTVIDPVLEVRLVRKMDIRLLPIVTLIYLFAFIDRSNAGNARVLGRNILKTIHIYRALLMGIRHGRRSSAHR